MSIRDKRGPPLVHRPQCRHQSLRRIFVAYCSTSLQHENVLPVSAGVGCVSGGISTASVELLQHLLDLGIFFLDNHEYLLNSLQALLIIGFVFGAILVLVLSKVLNLGTTVLDLSQPQGCRGSFQEVAQRGKRSEVFLLSVSQNQSSHVLCARNTSLTYKALSIFVKVSSACVKNPNTMDLLNSRSSSSSSISRICSKVEASMLSPRSGRPTEPSSLYSSLPSAVYLLEA
jgi:hypothetical protein